MFVGLLGVSLFFFVLLVIGIKWDEVSLNEVGVLLGIWMVSLAVCLSTRVQPFVFWFGVPTLFLNGYLVLKIFKGDPEIPRSYPH